MINLWFNEPTVLFTDYSEFMPKKGMNNNQKLNAIARLAIYYIIIISIFGLDSRWISIGITLLVVTYFMGKSEDFSTETKCTKPTANNPFMNFTVGDLMENPERSKACPFSEYRDEQLKLFNSNNPYLTTNDLWGKLITDRNFYTMPSTQVVNDQEGFAKFLLNDGSKCKSKGIDCLKNHDNRFHKGRYYYQY
jgi:hypothetical protein